MNYDNFDLEVAGLTPAPQSTLDEQKNKISTTLEYMGQSAKIGFNRGLTTLAYGFGTGELSEEEETDYRLRQNRIAELVAQRDDFYNSNKEELFGLGWVAGAAAEGLSNPLEMGTNMLISYATAGAPLIVKLGGHVLGDVSALFIQKQTIEEEAPTVTEIGLTAVGSVIPDLAGEYFTRRAMRAAGDYVPGNQSVQVRQLMDGVDDVDLYPGAGRIARQTKGTTGFSLDQVDIKQMNSGDVGLNATFLQRRAEVINQVKSEVTERATKKQETMRSIYKSRGMDDAKIEAKLAQELDIQVKMATSKIQPKSTDVMEDILQKAELEINTRIDVARTDNKIDHLTQAVDLRNARDTMKSRYLNYNDQKIRVADEYANLLGMKPQEYINQVGYDSVDLTNRWIRNDFSDLTPNEQKFWSNVTRDRELLGNTGVVGRVDYTVNKQAFLADYMEYYDFGDFDLSTSTIWDIPEGFVNAKQEVLSELTERINPLFTSLKQPDGIDFTTMGDVDKAKYFFEFMQRLNRTVENAKGSSVELSMKELSDEFISESAFVDFFTNVNAKYLKTNNEIVQDIFQKQSSEISMLDNFGTTSVQDLKNQARKTISNVEMSERFGRITAQDRKALLDSIANQYDQMLDNAFDMGKKVIEDPMLGVSSSLRNMLSRGTMYFGGVAEYAINPATAAIRALKYGESPIGAFKFSMMRQLRAMSGQVPNDIPSGRYVAAKLANELNIYRDSATSAKGLLQRTDSFGYSIMKHSDEVLSGYGSTYSTKILHELKSTSFDQLDNEVKRLLSLQGINQRNYTQFADYAFNHIESNGLYVNSAKLIDETNGFARQLNSLHNLMTSEVGNVNSNSILRTQSQDEIQKWLGMYRTFQRAMSTDVLKDTMYYTTEQGLKQSRISVGGLKSTFDPKNINNLAQATALLYAGGKGMQAIQDIAYGNRDLSERTALMKTRFESLKYNWDVSTPTERIGLISEDIWNEVTDALGFNIDQLKAQAPIISTVTRLEKELSKEPEDRELLVALGKEILSKRLIEGYQATKDSITQNYDEIKPIYGFTPLENQMYYQNTFNNRVSATEMIEAMQSLQAKSELAQAQNDYLNGTNTTFAILPEGVKSTYNQLVTDNQLDQAEIEAKKSAFTVLVKEYEVTGDVNELKLGLKTEFPVITSTEAELIKSIEDNKHAQILAELEGIKKQQAERMKNMADSQPTEVSSPETAGHQIETPPRENKFNELSDAKKEYYQRLIKFSGKEDTPEEQIKFHELFMQAKSRQVPLLLKEHYGIDNKEFNRVMYGQK